MLKLVIIGKILITIVIWVIPCLFFPAGLIRKIGFPELKPPVFIKLLGAAFLALGIGYMLALRDLNNGIYPANAVWVGFVSNGGASIVLAVYGFGGHWKSWGFFARSYMWFSFVSVSLIALGLFYYGIYVH